MPLHDERIARFKETGLYVVITEKFCNGRSPLEVLQAVLNAGVKLVQFREKNSNGLDLFTMASKFKELTAEAGALMIVNDRVDVALAVEADGVHLGQSDLPIDVARAMAPDLIIGASSHNLDEALSVQQAGADYVNIGPIFATQTKDVPTGAVGPEMIDTISPHLNIPFTVMGGIKPHNVDEVLRRGARHPAVVTAVTAADNVEAAAKELNDKILAARNKECCNEAQG